MTVHSSPFARTPSLCLATLICLATYPPLAQGKLIAIDHSIFNTEGGWELDIDGDGVPEILATSRSGWYAQNHAWFGGPRTSFPGISTTNSSGGFANPLAYTLHDGIFRAPAIIPGFGNLRATSPASSGGTLALASETNASFVSLAGFIFEPPTEGSLGFLSGQVHDDYWLYYHDFGHFAPSESAVLDFTGNVLTTSAIPEPAASELAMLGVFSLGFFRRRRKRR
ncbi:MAG: hypothetical protein AAGJ40_08340 [Planctomycetota bacterium]